MLDRNSCNPSHEAAAALWQLGPNQLVHGNNGIRSGSCMEVVSCFGLVEWGVDGEGPGFTRKLAL
jgi:hypothetical protein